MGNPSSRLSCLGERRSHVGARPRAQDRSPPLPAASRASLPPGTSWTWWGPRTVQVTEVTEVTEVTVTETVVTSAVLKGPSCRRGRAAPVPPGPLASLRSWLDGMEELQASQEPLAPDAATATAQLREQELLLRLLRGRGPQLDPRLWGEQDDTELQGQWERLVHRAEARWGSLQQLIPAAQSFEKARQELLGKLCTRGLLLAELQSGWTRPRRCLEATQHLQCVCREVPAQEGNLEQLLQCGQRLEELLAENEAVMVRGQLKQLQEWVQLAGDTPGELLQALDSEPPVPTPPLGEGSGLDLEGTTSGHKRLRNQKKVLMPTLPCPGVSGGMGSTNTFGVQDWGFLQLLLPLAQQVEDPWSSHLASIQEQTLLQDIPEPTRVISQTQEAQAQELALGPTAVLQAEWSSLGDHWSQGQEQDTVVTWRLAQKVWWSPLELAPHRKDLQLDGCLSALQVSWTLQAGDVADLGQESPWELLLWASPHWRRPILQGGTWTLKGSSHLDLLVELPGCWAAMGAGPMERPLTLEEALLFLAHLVEKLLEVLPTLCSYGPCWEPVARSSGQHRSFKNELKVPCPQLFCQKPGSRQGWAKLLGDSGSWTATWNRGACSEVQQQVVPAQPWRSAELPGLLGLVGLKHWTEVTGDKALTPRGPNLRWPGDAGSRASAQSCLTGDVPAELSWRPSWAEAATGNWGHRKSEPQERNLGAKEHRGLQQWLRPRQGALTHLDTVVSGGRYLWWLEHRKQLLWTENRATSLRKCGHARQQDFLHSILGSRIPGGQQPSHTLTTDMNTDRAELAHSQRPVLSSPRRTVQVGPAALMVRVGGGWVALDEFLVKNDPGRVKGRTSQKIYQRFLSWAGIPSRPDSGCSTQHNKRPSALEGLPSRWGHRDTSSQEAQELDSR